MLTNMCEALSWLTVMITAVTLCDVKKIKRAGNEVPWHGQYSEWGSCTITQDSMIIVVGLAQTL